LNAGVIRSVETPAYVFDERRVLRDLKAAAELRNQCGFKLLYSLKPLSCDFILDLMIGNVDGFSASSLFEARLAREAIGSKGSLHLTTPGLREGEIPELGDLCDHIALNSLSQLRRMAGWLEKPNQVGLRVNPELSVVDDERYDPCRPCSKLGVPLSLLVKRWSRTPWLFDDVSGLLLHTNCDSSSFEPLYRMVKTLLSKLGDLLCRLSWINLGGGYLLENPERIDLLADAVELLRSRHGLCVYIEPGAALVRKAGYLVASVIDIFRSGGKTIAVLDTTINHVPEVFEYQFEPDVLHDDDQADHEYLLAGSSCLAGDLMGIYGFAKRLRIGSRVVFLNVGAYALVKAHMFNGLNMPSIYSITRTGELSFRRRFTYLDYVSRFRACRDAAV
jgi:carboxynorspermidine decarboxylase